ncbi:MAG: MarR family EPS-associated transcriptional regulator, partial [Pseudomonadales bacterium]
MQDEITYKLLKSIEENPTQSQRELSKSLGISLGKLNYCLKALVDKGWVKARNFKNNPNKAGYLYLLTPSGVEAKTRVTVRFLRRKMDEYERIKAEIEALQEETRRPGSNP